MQDQDHYTQYEIRESKNFSTNTADLYISNENFNSGNGCVFIVINSNVSKASIAVTVTEREQLDKIISIFRSENTNKEVIVPTITEKFSFVNKQSAGNHIIEINKLVVTSSGRSRSGISIILDTKQIKEIHTLLINCTSSAPIRKNKNMMRS